LPSISSITLLNSERSSKSNSTEGETKKGVDQLEQLAQAAAQMAPQRPHHHQVLVSPTVHSPIGYPDSYRQYTEKRFIEAVDRNAIPDLAPDRQMFVPMHQERYVRPNVYPYDYQHNGYYVNGGAVNGVHYAPQRYSYPPQQAVIYGPQAPQMPMYATRPLFDEKRRYSNSQMSDDILGSEVSARRKKTKRAPKDPNAPKHPMSAFLFFLSQVRPSYTAKYPGSKVGIISKMISAAWKELTEQERKIYDDKATADKQRYSREMEEYLKNKHKAQLELAKQRKLAETNEQN